MLRGAKDVLELPGTHVHLYGKRETRAGRKMGHVTAITDTDSALDEAIALIKTHCTVIPDRAVPLSTTPGVQRTN